MNRTFKQAFVITGDASGGVKAFSVAEKHALLLQKAINTSSKGMNNYSRSLTKSSGLLNDFAINAKSALGILSGAALARETLQISDAAKQMDARISLATDSIAEMAIAQDRLKEVSRNTLSSLTANATLYARMAVNTEGLNISQNQLLLSVESLRNSFRSYGTEASEADAATLQLTQAMAKGKLDGDEFKSVMENAPLVMQALTKELGITKKELFEFSSEGKLGVEDLVNALSNSADEFAQKAAQMPVTMSEATTVLRNSLTLFVGDIDKASGASEILSNAVLLIANNIETVGQLLAGAAAIKLLAPTLNKIGASVLVAHAGIQRFGIGMTVANTKAALLERTLFTLKSGMALLGGPAGIFALAAFGVYELVTAMEVSQERLDELTFKSDEAAKSLSEVFGLVTENKQPEAIEAIGNAIENELIKLQKFRDQLANIGSDNFFRRDDGSVILSTSQAAEANQAKQSIDELNRTIEEMRTVMALAENDSGELAVAVETVSSAYQAAGKFINMFGIELPGIITNEKLLVQQNRENKTSIDEWLESSEKQLQKLTRQNEVHGLTQVQVIELDAARIKALATDKKTEKQIEEITKSLISEAKERESLLKIDKENKARQKADQKLLEEAQTVLEQYGSQAQRVAIAERLRTEELEKYAVQAEKMPGIIDAVNRKYDQQIEKITGVDKAKEELIKQEQHEAEILQEQYQAQLDFIANLEFEESLLELTTFEREKAILSRELEAKNIHLTTEALERLLKVRGIEKGFGINDTFEGLISQGKTLGDILKQAAEGFKNGLKGGAQSLNILLQGGKFVFDTFKSHSGKDGAGQILSTINDLAPLFGAVGVAISGIANTINSIFGGGLFGTSFETTGSTANLLINDDGVGGQLAIEQKRKRSLFRGTQRQTIYEDLDAQVISGLETIRDSALESMRKIAAELGVEVPEIIAGGFFKEFDADGNLIREYSEIAGKQFNETIEQFGKRFVAENTISLLDSVLPLVEQIYTAMVPGEGQGDYDFGLVPEERTRFVGEATALAEDFRDQGADALLDFAQFATIAVTQMQDNAALLETLTENLDITQELQGPGESLVETYNRISTATSIYEEALGVMGISLDVTREEFIRLSASMAEAAGGTQKLAGLWQNYFENYFTPEELRAQSLQSSSELLGQQAANLGIDPTITQEQFRELFQAHVAAGNLTEEQQVLWLQFAKTLSTVNTLIEENTAAERERLEVLQQSQQEYADFNQSITDQLGAIGSSEAINSIASIRAQHQQNIETLNDLAIAAGQAAASEEDLMRVHQLAQAQIDQVVGRLREAISTLQDQLYGDQLERRIAELEELEGVNRRGFASVQSSSNSLFDNWRRAIDNLRDYSRSLIFSQHSPLESGNQLDQALADFYAAVAAAQAGDLSAAQSLPGLADLVLGLNDQVNASGSDFNLIFDGVQDALNSIDIPNGISDNIIQGNFSVTPSAELQRLYDQLEARNAAASADNRLQLATQLAQHLRELALAINEPLFNIAGQIGLNMTDLVTDLGVNLDDLTAASVQNLANIANLLGVELSDLATNLGEDVSEAMGDLADSQSLLNDALEGTIDDLPAEYRDLLAPLLRDVEQAADGEAQEIAIGSLEEATAGLPIEYRNLLAPYFDNIDQTTEMELQSNYMQEQIDWLRQIRDILASGNPYPQLPPIGPLPADDPNPQLPPADPPQLPPIGPLPAGETISSSQNTETAELKKLIVKQNEMIDKLTTIIKFQHIDKMNANKKIIANTGDTASNTKKSSFPNPNRKINQ